MKKPTRTEIDKYREVLRHLRREISGDIDKLEEDAFSRDGERASVDNLADVGSDSFSQEFSLELMERDGETLAMIEEALDRIENGTFGRCEACETWIARARLQAMPYARNCISCQREMETEG